MDESNNESGQIPSYRMGFGSNFQNINDVSELGSMIQRDPTNSSILKYRVDKFGINQNGQINLGMA